MKNLENIQKKLNWEKYYSLDLTYLKSAALPNSCINDIDFLIEFSDKFSMYSLIYHYKLRPKTIEQILDSDHKFNFYNGVKSRAIYWIGLFLENQKFTKHMIEKYEKDIIIWTNFARENILNRYDTTIPEEIQNVINESPAIFISSWVYILLKQKRSIDFEFLKRNKNVIFTSETFRFSKPFTRTRMYKTHKDFFKNILLQINKK